ncbi:lamin tail domain-containing protein [Streptomyces sp. NPDC054794]
MSVSIPLTVRRLTAAAGVAAAVVGAVALPASAADHHAATRDRDRVVISGVQYHSPGRDDRSNRSLNREWVELTNNSHHDLNLDGWVLSDADGHRYIFRHYWLDARGSVRVHTGFGTDTERDLYQDRRREIWDNADTATLRNARGDFIDDTSWGTRRYDGSHRRYDDDRYDHRRYEGDRRHGDGRHEGDRRHGDDGRD